MLYRMRKSLEGLKHWLMRDGTGYLNQHISFALHDIMKGQLKFSFDMLS